MTSSRPGLQMNLGRSPKGTHTIVLRTRDAARRLLSDSRDLSTTSWTRLAPDTTVGARAFCREILHRPPGADWPRELRSFGTRLYTVWYRSCFYVCRRGAPTNRDTERTMVNMTNSLKRALRGISASSTRPIDTSLPRPSRSRRHGSRRSSRNLKVRCSALRRSRNRCSPRPTSRYR